MTAHAWPQATWELTARIFFRQIKLPFRAPIGVGLEVEDYDGFARKYDLIVGDLKKKHEIATSRKCLKSHYIHEKNPSSAGAFMREFTKGILPLVKTVFVYHTILSSQSTPKIFCYGGKATMAPDEFISQLQSTYPHVVAWKILDEFPDKKDSSFMLDHFTGRITKAWKQIEHEDISIYQSGEYCNPLISSADLVSKYVSDFLHARNLRLQHDSIYKAFQPFGLKEARTDLRHGYIYDLSMITPHEERAIDAGRNLKHPVYFLLTSKKFNHELDALKHTALFDIIANRACDDRGSIHAMNIDAMQNELKIMRDGDKIVAFGAEALSLAGYIVNDIAGLSVEVISSRDLK